MLILIKGDIEGFNILKNLLDSFFGATILHINFHKSTFIPMHIDEDASTQMANSLGCAMSSFPQPYLGLPSPQTSSRSVATNLSSPPLVAI